MNWLVIIYPRYVACMILGIYWNQVDDQSGRFAEHTNSKEIMLISADILIGMCPLTSSIY